MSAYFKIYSHYRLDGNSRGFAKTELTAFHEKMSLDECDWPTVCLTRRACVDLLFHPSVPSFLLLLSPFNSIIHSITLRHGRDGSRGVNARCVVVMTIVTPILC